MIRDLDDDARVAIEERRKRQDIAWEKWQASLKADRERIIRNMFSTIFVLGFVFALGCFFGMLIQDRQLWRMNRAQQERGDYWFDRYMMEVRPDWKPYTEDLREVD